MSTRLTLHTPHYTPHSQDLLRWPLLVRDVSTDEIYALELDLL